ncbi:MAG: hypothetical protein K1060chlam2_00194 [Chlamydiae bacterium]|nr:hypothetical protein [Chlamydiota bacterium]
MSKIVPLPFQPSELTKFKKVLADKQLSFVLITCTQPTKEGKMTVELECDGDRDLLALLLESAQSRLG